LSASTVTCAVFLRGQADLDPLPADQDDAADDDAAATQSLKRRTAESSRT